MLSYECSENQEAGILTTCTTASIFEKPNSMRFELLFGNFQKKMSQRYSGSDIINAFNYLFLPSEIFGFSYESYGKEYERLHHTFILRCCSPGEIGHIIPGVSPGAEILVATVKAASSLRLKSLIKKLQENKIDLSKIFISDYRQLNYLLNTKSNTDFFIGELIEKNRKN